MSTVIKFAPKRLRSTTATTKPSGGDALRRRLLQMILESEARRQAERR